ncbi:hypothetical protein [Pelagibacterium mangrovi]|uniref:hypothetical protein n=1 Tax=Pelagibacterium mangrovi TaxID=3119828 RepID=UPI002FCB9BD8
MTKPIATAAFAEKTGKSWQGWLDFLDGIGAGDLSHAEIARSIVETGEASGWWAQGITVAYEQHIGRRQPGQRSNGGYEVSVSKTVSGSPEEALGLWSAIADGLHDADGVAFAGEAETSASEKWRYWRRGLADGTRVGATIGEKPGGKATIAVTHEKLADEEAVARWRGYWKSVLAALGRG